MPDSSPLFALAQPPRDVRSVARKYFHDGHRKAPSFPASITLMIEPALTRFDQKEVFGPILTVCQSVIMPFAAVMPTARRVTLRPKLRWPSAWRAARCG